MNKTSHEYSPEFEFGVDATRANVTTSHSDLAQCAKAEVAPHSWTAFAGS
jgi:hypothetical protein